MEEFKEKDRDTMLKNLDIMLDEEETYEHRVDAYEYLLEDCDEIVDEMVKHIYTVQGDTSNMLMEILSGYKGNKAVFMGLVSNLYKGEDVALYARLLGSYGDEDGIEVIKNFLTEYEPNYNEFMELRNAVEELGGDFTYQSDFTDDPFYRYLKGLDEVDDETRESPFKDMWHDEDEEEDGECDDDECGCHCHHESECGDDGCHCHHDSCGDDDCGCHHDCDSEDDDECHCHDHGHGDGCHCHDHDRKEGCHCHHCD